MCTACPLCAALAGLREVSPEALSHLATAMAELLAAGRALLQGLDSARASSGPTIERIRIS